MTLLNHNLKYTFSLLSEHNAHYPYSYRKRDIELLLRLTDSFTWEELPTKDPDTGYLTKAGYIPIIQRLAKYVFWFTISFHFIQSTVRMVISREMFLTSWFPFDLSATSVYICANITQVQFTV